MDPDAALDAIRAQVKAYYEMPPSPDFSLDKLVESVEALDEFLGKGGFLPSAWHRASAAKGERVFKLPPHQ